MTKQRLPDWFKASKGKLAATRKLSTMLEREVPNSICQEARCPNRSDCFEKGILTFMILGITCTRNCSFCSVQHGVPKAPDQNELSTILRSIEKLNLRFVVLTSPNRDDLEDGGAEHYAMIVRGIKKAYPHIKVEVLIPDFLGDRGPLEKVLAAKPDVLNHNVETVPSLYSDVRKGSIYKRSLKVLKMAKEINPSILTKSGLMVGLGETDAELLETFKDIRDQATDILTLGQYLKPDKNSANVDRYVSPDEFKKLEIEALGLGYKFVFAGPLVRSSYLAEHVFDDTVKQHANLGII
ncbi:lipoyl synthase [Candidatus Marinamargulisbacteria bacterium SCGC AAA071-K20]|nr:lipoyl synthase [Candidatus Marinamargulisbacteria bacterium SCGC AAA071-K20]